MKGNLKKYLFGTPLVLFFLLFYFVSQYNYLLFHISAELFSIVVGGCIFVIAWNSRHLFENNYLLILGIAYLYIAIIDFAHLLTYHGMNVWPTDSTYFSVQLWIAARSIESLSLLGSLLFFHRKINAYFVHAIYIAVSAAFLVSIFFLEIFPVCFVEGVGLTPFKKVSEYIISFILAAAMILIYRKRDHFEGKVFTFVLTSIAVTILAELMFTFYVHLYGLSNFLGHCLKIVSFYFIYKALIENGLRIPYSVIFRNLKKSEESLRAKTEKLEQAFSEIKTLKGLLPICASCKKIREDDGYWKQIDVYIREHSEATFTHSICPDCIKRLYPHLNVDLSKS